MCCIHLFCFKELGAVESLEPSYPNQSYPVIDWGSKHAYKDSKADSKIPWSRKEIDVIGKWFQKEKQLGERNKATPSKFLADAAKNHLHDIVPYVHITHALHPTRLAYAVNEYNKLKEM